MVGRRTLLLVLLVLGWLGCARQADAQIGSLISPGKLSKAHVTLEGVAKCQQCHEQGRRVTVQKCLACHQPISERMAMRVGVHKDVKDDCVKCHSEHAGLDGEVRPFDQKNFDHAKVTGFALDGKHAAIAAKCDACHKTRSFITLKSDCVSCHADVHKPSLGTNCIKCHSTDAAFKGLASRFDHTKTAFQLVGAHRTVACTTCHVNGAWKGIAFSTCASCHQDPHQQRLGATCTTCHSNDTWRTTKIDHGRTAYPLVAKHIAVPCASCHTQPAMKVTVKADTCAVCHVDVHRGEFKQDCKACHSESGFGGAPFDHSTTKFALTAKHEGLECVKCHTNLPAASIANVAAAERGGATDQRNLVYTGLKTECVSCHMDVHQGQLGATCESCHSVSTFHVTGYVHVRQTAFFAGQHASVTCEKCHLPSQPTRTGAPVAAVVRYAGLPETCTACHADVHLGQVNANCETCHNVATAKFATVGFGHAQTRFALTGKHEQVACALCHKQETGVFPSGRGTAVRYRGVATECLPCHEDVHLGQLATTCETCHGTTTFKLANYKHTSRALNGFFVGRHATAKCVDCHASTNGQFPHGRGTAIQYAVGTACVACHSDVHHGSLGPNCGDCHKP